MHLKQEELGDRRWAKNRTTVNNYLRLLKLPQLFQAAIRDQNYLWECESIDNGRGLLIKPSLPFSTKRFTEE